MDDSPLPLVFHNHSLNRPASSSPEQSVRSRQESSLDNRRPTSAPARDIFNRTSSRYQCHRSRPSSPSSPREPNANCHRAESPKDHLRPSTPNGHADLNYQGLEPSSSDAPPSSTHQIHDPDHYEPDPPSDDAAPSPTNQYPSFNHDQSPPHSGATSPPPNRHQPSFSHHIPTATSFNLPPSAAQQSFPRDDEDAQDNHDWSLCHTKIVSRVNALPTQNVVNTAKDIAKYPSHCEQHLHYPLQSNAFSRAIEAQGNEKSLRFSSPSPTLCPSTEAELVANAVDAHIHGPSTEGVPQSAIHVTAETPSGSDAGRMVKAADYPENADIHEVRGKAVQYGILKRADVGQARELHDLKLGEAGTSPGSENAGIADVMHVYDVPSEGVHRFESQATEEFCPCPDPGPGFANAGTAENPDTSRTTREKMQNLVRQETEFERGQGEQGVEVVTVDHNWPKWRKEGELRRNIQQQLEEDWYSDAESRKKDQEKRIKEQQERSGNKARILAKPTHAQQKSWKRRERRRLSRQRHREDGIEHGQTDEVYEVREANRGEVVQNAKPHDPRPRDAEQMNEPPKNQTLDVEQAKQSQRISTAVIAQDTSSQRVKTDVQTPELREIPPRDPEQIDQPPNLQRRGGGSDIPSQRAANAAVDQDILSKIIETSEVGAGHETQAKDVEQTTIEEDKSSQRTEVDDERPHAREARKG